MLRTTNVMKNVAWAWVLVATFYVFTPCLGQEDSFQEPTSKPQPSVFERLFGTSSSQMSQTPKPKAKVPASTTAGKTSRSGFLVPLKSFSKAFRGPSESEDAMEIEEDSPPRLIMPRVPREPFRNLPRVQERRELENVDLRVEKTTTVIQPPTNYPRNPSKESKLSPIVHSESSKRAANTSSAATSKPSTSKSVTAGNSKSPVPEIVIESNSTSRRTATETAVVETATPNRFAIPTQEKSNSKSTIGSVSSISNSQDGKKLEPKSLLDLGQPSDKSTATLTNAPSREKTSSPPIAEPLNDLPKISRSGNGNPPKNETKNKGLSSPNASAAPTPIAASLLRREMSVPGVKVTVNGPISILVDEEGSYEIVAKNEGTESLNGLIVRVAVPAQVTIGNVAVTDGVAHPDNDQEGNSIIWELEQLPGGSSKTATVKLKTPKAEHFALGVEWTVLPQNAEMKIEVHQPQLAIALEGPSEVTFGKPQIYRIRVRNTGNVDVKAISVSMSAEPYGVNQSEIGDIAAGSERVVEVELTFQQSGSLPIVATATSKISKLEVRSAIDVQVRQSELIATWLGPTEFYQGSVIDYELELSNIGSVPAMETHCMIQLPSGVDVVLLPPGAVRNGEFIKWEINRIDPQEKLTLPLRLSMSKIGDNQLVFTSQCSSSAETKAEFKTNIDAIADLHLTVVDPAAPAPVGQPVVYEVVIANRGKKLATDVEVIAQFSEGIEPVRVEGHTGRIVPGQAIFNSIPSIGPNDKLVLRIHAEASKPGVHRFRVEVKSKGSDTDLLEEESTRYLATSIKGDRR